jgi:hypothetical protein
MHEMLSPLLLLLLLSLSLFRVSAAPFLLSISFKCGGKGRKKPTTQERNNRGRKSGRLEGTRSYLLAFVSDSRTSRISKVLSSICLRKASSLGIIMQLRSLRNSSHFYVEQRKLGRRRGERGRGRGA